VRDRARVLGHPNQARGRVARREQLAREVARCDREVPQRHC